MLKKRREWIKGLTPSWKQRADANPLGVFCSEYFHTHADDTLTPPPHAYTVPRAKT